MIAADATEALRALGADELLLCAVGRVKLCYIDPPYNTGDRFTYYDDKRDSGEWLAYLREQLTLLRPLLTADGSVWLHLDDNEQHRARMVMDEVFGRDAFVATIIWQKRLTRENRTAFSSQHDYIHVYAPAGPKAWKRTRNGLADEAGFQNPDGDPRGPWRSAPMTAQSKGGRPNQVYRVTTPTGVQHDPPPGRCWSHTEDSFRRLLAEGRIHWPSSGDGKPRVKTYEAESGGLAPFTIWTAAEVGDTSVAKKSLMRDFPGLPAFDTPKPVALLERIVHIATDPGDLVLDFYLGSGTTAIAAQTLGREWIGVERSRTVIDTFVLPRVAGCGVRAA